MTLSVDGLEPVALSSLERLNVEQYHAMVQAGVLREGEPIELIDGLLFRKDRRDRGGDVMTVGPRHAQAVRLLLRALTAACASLDGIVQSQQPLTLSETDEPEPDVSVVRGTEDDFVARHPGAGDVALACEVADSSLAFDRGLKRAAYSRAGVPEYWIVDLRNRRVEVFRDPRPGEDGYSQHHVYGEDDAIPFTLLGASCNVAVKDLLPIEKPSSR